MAIETEDILAIILRTITNWNEMDTRMEVTRQFDVLINQIRFLFLKPRVV